MSAYMNGDVAITEAYFDTDKANFNADGNSITRTYKIRHTLGTDIDEGDVVAGIAAATSLVLSGLIRRDVDATRVSNTIWYATVTWEAFKPTSNTEAGYEEIIRGSTSGSRVSITQAIDHIATYTEDGPVSDINLTHAGALNVTGDKVKSKPSPTDIASRSLEFSIERAFAPGTVDFAYINTLYQLTATVNNAAFRGLAAGEVLFLGAEFSLSNLVDEKVTFNFAASPNVYGSLLGSFNGSGGITVNSKLGWEYLWTEHKVAALDADNGKKQRKARLKAVHVEQVYYTGDFSLFGI